MYTWQKYSNLKYMEPTQVRSDFDLSPVDQIMF